MFSLTMVVPAFNEEELIDEFLEKSVRDMSAVSDDWEIVIVDDGSTDRTYELATAWTHVRTLRLADGPDAVHRRQVARAELKKHTQEKI